jgi:ketosteroid isomerase-like protein
MLEGWRSALVEKHQNLLKVAHPEVGDGWRDLVERAVSRIALAVRELSPHAVEIVQIKQKFGGIRIYWHARRIPDAVASRIEEAVDVAEARSLTTCEVCGEEGKPWHDHGWLSTCCERHGRGRPLLARTKDDVIERYAIDPGGRRRLISRRRYDRARDVLIDLPIDPRRSTND